MIQLLRLILIAIPLSTLAGCPVGLATIDQADAITAAVGADLTADAYEATLRERWQSGLRWRYTADGKEVFFDGSIVSAVRWTAISVCLTVGGAVFIVFASLVRSFLPKR